MTNKFDFTHDYKEKLNELISILEANASTTSREGRSQLIETITDEYVAQVGKTPPSDALTRMADVMLHEELTDSHPDKITREEYPILSDRMYAVRTKGRERRKNKAGVTTMEVPLEHGKNVATDGDNYTAPVRSFSNAF
jgi:hypothetical protein